MGAHRDHFILKASETQYLMYVVGTYNKKGAVSCFYSSDLLNWEFIGYALTSGDDAPLNPGWGAMESPFVVEKDGSYYLFVTYADCSDETYSNILVFHSEDPRSFGEYNGGKGGALPITTLQAHVPEVLYADGKYYITTCGRNISPVPNKGAVSIAPLDWE